MAGLCILANSTDAEESSSEKMIPLRGILWHVRVTWMNGSEEMPGRKNGGRRPGAGEGAAKSTITVINTGNNNNNNCRSRCERAIFHAQADRKKEVESMESESTETAVNCTRSSGFSSRR